MNKRIISISLMFTLILTMLANAMPTLAVPSDPLCTFTIEADKISATPGDEITYTISMQQCDTLTAFAFEIVIPSGLTFVAESYQLGDTAVSRLGANFEFTPESDLLLSWFDSNANDYTNTDTLELITFKCTVDADVVEDNEYEVKLTEVSVCAGSTLNYDDITEQTSVVTAKITVAIPHTHVFDKEVATSEYLKSSATCTEPAVYYKSCECKEKGTATFTDGNALGHDYTKKVEIDTYLKSTASNCTEHNEYWYACSRCDANAKDDNSAADKHYTGTAIGEHLFTEKLEDDAHYVEGTGSDCTSVKQYYYDCAYCDTIGEKTWDSTVYGPHSNETTLESDETGHWKVCTICKNAIPDTKEGHTPDHDEPTEEYPVKCTECDFIIKSQLEHTHKFDQEVTSTKYLKSPATCTTPALYYMSCKCGEKGEVFFESGEPLEHNFKKFVHDDENHWYVCTICGEKDDNSLEKHDFTISKQDDKSHWDECICGAKDSSSYAEHTLVTTNNEDTHTFACSGCNYSKTAKHSPEIINFVDATYDSEGYSGDVVCKDCEYLIAKGTVIPKRSFIIIFPPVTDTGNSGTGENESGSETDPVKPEDWTNPFTDITETDECYEAVRFVNENGLIIGMSTTEFAPEVVMNRAMFVTILGRAEGIPEDGAADGRFEDVETDTWYSPFIGWADESGIITGYSDTVFGPLDNITVEQACVILARYAEYLGYDISAEPLGEDSGFEDVADISDWAVKGMAWAVQSGIYTADSSLNPGAPATRAMVAMMLYRLSGVVTEFLG